MAFLCLALSLLSGFTQEANPLATEIKIFSPDTVMVSLWRQQRVVLSSSYILKDQERRENVIRKHA